MLFIIFQGAFFFFFKTLFCIATETLIRKFLRHVFQWEWSRHPAFFVTSPPIPLLMKSSSGCIQLPLLSQGLERWVQEGMEEVQRSYSYGPNAPAGASRNWGRREAEDKDLRSSAFGQVESWQFWCFMHIHLICFPGLFKWQLINTSRLMARVLHSDWMYVRIMECVLWLLPWKSCPIYSATLEKGERVFLQRQEIATSCY